jgi:hypothetical protein
LSGAGVNPFVTLPGRQLATIAWFVAALACSWTAAAEPVALDAAYAPSLEPANWQESVAAPLPPQTVPPQTAAPEGVVLPVPPQTVPPEGAALPVPPPPEQTYIPPPTPLLDEDTVEEELTPPGGATNPVAQRRGVRPYGGGHPDDWPWGCNGSPFRTGPGFCDTWEVGCRWDVAVDGIVMRRDDTDLLALESIMRQDVNNLTGTIGSYGTADLIPATEQFDYGVGGRVWMTSKLPKSLWQMHFGYEGIEEWDASVVFPKQSVELDDFVPGTDPPTPPINVPPGPTDAAFEQRRLHYKSSLHAAELNFVRDCGVVRPYCGVRYVKFDDEINDFFDQEVGFPLPAQVPAFDTLFPPVGPVITTDRFNIFDIENNLIGFQIGARHDLWRPNRRMAIQGFVNSGVYYNRIKYTSLMGIFTTEAFGDNVNTPLAGDPPAADTTDLDESRLDVSNVVNNDVREYDEISYVTEASISGVCRINKCWALRAGYQAMWINNVHLAEDAYLGTDLEGRSLFFHGWHAGVEHRR